MKHVIIGTAGHVDHGKTTLIKALTGIDTDRLQEEKKRGITIELGFAHLDFEDGLQAGIVDVPGHEKFIKNMLAGAGGIDLAMLLVAADEGFMPQTIEHLGILQLLGIKEGIVVITKTDMVDEDWLEMIKEDVASHVKGTFLEGKPVFCVSAYTGQGIDQLRSSLHDLVLQTGEKNMRTPYRLPIDRVFSVEGFGTVVTGTLIEGAVSIGDSAVILPDGLECRVRNIQVHSKDTQTAYAGQRVAINLAGIKKSDISRGNCVAAPGSTPISLMLDVHLQNLPNSERIIINNSQVHLYHGSSESLAKVVLLDRECLEPGQNCYAQLRLTEEIATRKGDRFVVRFLSPLETIGGGVVIDPKPYKHKRNDASVLELLAIKENGSEDQKLVQVIEEYGLGMATVEALAKQQNVSSEEMQESLAQLANEGKVLEILPGNFIASAVFDKLYQSCQKVLEDYHKANPLQFGIKVAELRQKAFGKTDVAKSNALLQRFVSEEKLKTAADRYALTDFNVQLTKKQRSIKDRLTKLYVKAAHEAPTTDELLQEFSPGDKTDVRQVIDNMLSEGLIVMLAPGVCIDKSAYDAVCAKTAEYFTTHSELTLADFRDMLGTSRKYALYILEYFDITKILKKDGDVRRIEKGF